MGSCMKTRITEKILEIFWGKLKFSSNLYQISMQGNNQLLMLLLLGQNQISMQGNNQ